MRCLMVKLAKCQLKVLAREKEEERLRVVEMLLDDAGWTSFHVAAGKAA